MQSVPLLATKSISCSYASFLYGFSTGLDRSSRNRNELTAANEEACELRQMEANKKYRSGRICYRFSSSVLDLQGSLILSTEKIREFQFYVNIPYYSKEPKSVTILTTFN